MTFMCLHVHYCAWWWQATLFQWNWFIYKNAVWAEAADNAAIKRKIDIKVKRHNKNIYIEQKEAYNIQGWHVHQCGHYSLSTTYRFHVLLLKSLMAKWRKPIKYKKGSRRGYSLKKGEKQHKKEGRGGGRFLQVVFWA